MTKPSPTESHILRLPDELLLQVAGDLSIATLSALAKSCRRTYSSLIHELYARALRDETRSRAEDASEHISIAVGRIGQSSAVRNLMEQRPLDGEQSQAYWTECLCEAAANGHTDIVKYLLEAGVRADSPFGGPVASRPIFAAAANNHVAIVELLLASGVQTGAPDDVKYCPLHAAMVWPKQPNMVLVKMLLDRLDYPIPHLTTLLYAVSGAGRADMAKLMLDAGADISARDAEGKTPLCLAVDKGDYETIRLLLSRGASVTNVDNIGATPLCLAVENREASSAAIVKLLVQHGANPNERYPNGQTPLHVATNMSGGKDEVVLALLELGADWRVTERDLGTTPLLNAMQTSPYPCSSIQHLIDFGAACYPPHYTPPLLYFAAKLCYCDIVKRYIEYGGDPEAKCDIGTHRRIKAIFPAVWAGREEVLKLILPWVSDMDWKNSRNGSAVTEAAWAGSEESIRLVLERATRKGVEAAEWRGRTALMFAAETKSTQTVSLILEKCLDVHARDSQGRTALHYAVHGGNPGNVALLLQKGLDPTIKDAGGVTPHRMAMCSESPEIIDLIYEQVLDTEVLNLVGETPLVVACGLNRFEAAKTLLKHDADTEARRGHFKMKPLTIACKGGHEELVELLIGHGADLLSCSRAGRTNIGIAAYGGYSRIVTLMLEHGVPIDLMDSHMQTPLISAAIAGHAEAVCALTAANIDHGDNKGRTALSYAAESGHNGIVWQLLKQEADPNLPDHVGRTPLAWSVISGNIEGIHILIDFGADLTQGDKEGVTPVSHAMTLGNERAIKALYKKHYDW
ncbi:ankyrin repeat-containing domain protein [Aspergillus ambiguus]|uniref:ankyrin repeat-containing domain protein n=1 Tax=Aspergillus ambiguus TaxID=176160 RepID=UPI003CCDA392